MPRKDAGATPGVALVAVLGAITIGGAVHTAMAADAAHGKVVFQTCAACHNEKPDAIGPNLRGVYGRKVRLSR